MKEVGKIFLEESKSFDKHIDNEIDYLMDLHKFRAQKAIKIRRSIFKDVDPEILDLSLLGKFPYNPNLL